MRRHDFVGDQFNQSRLHQTVERRVLLDNTSGSFMKTQLLRFWLWREGEDAKHDKAVACLTKDREALLAFFDFPAEHWDHLRTSNPIESVFATVRHRTVRTKGALSAKTAKLMVFKLVNAAAKTWRRLKGENQLPKVVQGVKFQNGIEVIKMSAHHAA